MNREHSKPIHVFREGSRGCLYTRMRNEGKRKERLQAQRGREREPIKEGVEGGTILKPNAFAPWRVRCNELYVNEIVSIVFSRRGVVSLSVLRGLIEKQRLQFHKIHTSDRCRRACFTSCGFESVVRVKFNFISYSCNTKISNKRTCRKCEIDRPFSADRLII